MQILLQAGCAVITKTQPVPQGDSHTPYFTRDKRSIDYSGISFTPWDTTIAGIEPEPEVKPYTIMIYMNGSDLESENGAATQDISEILNSGVDTERVNIIIFTGGTYRWHIDKIPADECVIWRVENGNFRKIAGVGLRNMGNAGTLSSFIEFSQRSFPAEKYGLILWDHGGGSIAGYGHDELFNESCLTLLEMDLAFEKAGLGEHGTKLEFLGFDACLMATIEMAVVASEYARYLVASEDLEPGDGWDYTFLGHLKNQNGAELGRYIADYYVKYYGAGTTDSITMSVVDLSRAGEVMGAMSELMSRCSASLTENRQVSFTALAKRRNMTKTFGLGTRRDGDCDMVDLADMAGKLADIYPAESMRLLQSLGCAVVYNRHNSLSRLGGLTAYYIFGGKEDAQGALATYASLGMDREYTNYLMAFAVHMSGEGMSAGADVLDSKNALWEGTKNGGALRMIGKRGENEFINQDGKWPVICGKNVCLDEIGQTEAGMYYAVPAQINGEDADIVVLISDEYPDGRILGTRKEDGYIIQKGFNPLENGDELAIYYRTAQPGSDRQEGWELSDTVTVENSPSLVWRAPDTGRALYSGVISTDIRQNEFFTIKDNFLYIPNKEGEIFR